MSDAPSPPRDTALLTAVGVGTVLLALFVLRPLLVSLNGGEAPAPAPAAPPPLSSNAPGPAAKTSPSGASPSAAQPDQVVHVTTGNGPDDFRIAVPLPKPERQTPSPPAAQSAATKSEPAPKQPPSEVPPPRRRSSLVTLPSLAGLNGEVASRTDQPAAAPEVRVAHTGALDGGDGKSAWSVVVSGLPSRAEAERVTTYWVRQTKQAASISPSSGRYSVRAGSFSTQADAEEAAERLSSWLARQRKDAEDKNPSAR